MQASVLKNIRGGDFPRIFFNDHVSNKTKSIAYRSEGLLFPEFLPELVGRRQAAKTIPHEDSMTCLRVCLPHSAERFVA